MAKVSRKVVGLGIVALVLGGLTFASRELWGTVNGRELVRYQLYASRLEPAAPPIPAPTRDGRWQQDLDYLATELPRLHRNAFHTVSKSQFETAVRQLSSQIATLSDDAVRVRLMTLVASVGDGHTSMYREQAKALFPVQFQSFGSSYYVTGSVSPELLSARLVAVNGMQLERVLEKLRPAISHDNAVDLRIRLGRALADGEMLHGVGVLENTARAKYTFTLRNGRSSTQTLEGVTQAMFPTLLPLSSKPMLYNRPSDSPFWLEYQKEKNLLYVRYLECDDPKGQMSAFVEQVKKTLSQNENVRVIVDLRGNSGGSSAVLQPLIQVLGQHFKGSSERFFAAIDGNVYSSAMQNAFELGNAGATLVGSPTGGKPNSYAEVRQLTLPNSRLGVQYSTRYFEDSPGVSTESILPDVRIEPTLEDEQNGRDPVLEYILTRALSLNPRENVPNSPTPKPLT